MRYQATEDLAFGDTSIPIGTTIVEIQRADVERPVTGDLIVIGDEDLKIMGEPRLDKQGLKWLCEAPPRG